IPGGEAQKDGATQPAARDNGANHHAREEFQRTAFRAQRVSEDLPTHSSNGGELPASLLRSAYPNQDNSCSVDLVPPTMRRKMSSSVHFPPVSDVPGVCDSTPVRNSSREPCATNMPRSIIAT